MTHIPLCTDHTVTRTKTFTKPSPKRTNMKAREKPVNNFLFRVKVSDRNRKKCETCSKVTIKIFLVS